MSAPEPGPVVELGFLPKLGAFLTFTAGIAAFFGGAQIATMILFRSALAEWIPVLQAAAGIAACALATQLAHPRRWALFASLALLGLLGCMGAPWAMWLVINGVFTALVWFAPAWSAMALAVVAVGARETLRVARARAAAEAETERLVAEATAMGLYTPPPPTPRWLYPTVATVVGVPAALFGAAMWAPEQLAWLDTRMRGMAHGRNPLGSAFVDRASDYPYEGSPLQWYLDYEARWVPFDTSAVLAVADAIAEETSWRMAAEGGVANPADAERALWTEGRGREIPLWIAEGLRRRGAFYHMESLFSRSFDADAHLVPDTFHLDCDQLAYVFLHVAWRLDLAMKAIPSPMHVYVRYDGPAGEPPIFVETTQFRSIDIEGNHVDFAGETIGESFFVDADYYSSGRSGTWATEELVAAAGLYEPWTSADIRDSIVGNVLEGLRGSGKAPYPQEAEAHVGGSRDITLVSNLYQHYVQAAESALDEGRAEEARAAATRARELRAEFGVLVIWVEPREEAVLSAL